MSMTIQERSAFLRRAGEGYERQQRWARELGKYLPYRLQEFRDLIENRLEEKRCPYCRGPLAAATFCLDHKVPIARNGRLSLKNLEVCCPDCHTAKGFLDAIEFKDLLAVMDTWPRPVVRNFLAQLQAGAALVQNPLPRVGSLEWFTGSEEAHKPMTIRKRHPAPKQPDPLGEPEKNHESRLDQTALGDPPGHGRHPV